MAPPMQPLPFPYGVSLTPVPAVVPPPLQMPVQAYHGQSGPTPWYGRTRNEVEHDNAFMAAQAHSASMKATQNFKPDAKPDDVFWVWEADGRTRNLYRFAVISAWDDGHWRIDHTSQTAYYLRGRKH
jgi:hypothetical protein